MPLQHEQRQAVAVPSTPLCCLLQLLLQLLLQCC
jgi:hypothetical protein